MKYLFPLIALFVAVLPATAFALTAEELAGKLQETYDRTRDLSAEFSQVSVVKAVNIERHGEGRLVIKKPGMLRYSYEKPERQEIIVRGEELVMYMPESNQAIKKKLARAMVDKTPATFLAGLGKITDSFNVRIPARGEKDKDGSLLLELLPKGDKMGVEKIVLSLDPKTYDIKAFSFTDVSGNVNTITLSGMKINKGVRREAFDFDIPPNTRVITQ